MKYSPDELLVAALVLSIFISVYATVAVVMIIIGYLIWQNQIKHFFDSVAGLKYLAVFFALTVVVSIMNANVQGILAAFALMAVFIVAAFTRQVMTRILFDRIVEISCTASLFSFIVIVLQRIKGPGSYLYRAESTFLNANYYAAATEIVVLFCLYRLLRPSAGSRFYPLLVLLCNLCGLFLSDCRTACLALGAGCLLLLFLNHRYKAVGMALAGMTILALLILISPDIFPRTTTMQDDLNVRISIWLTALRGFLKHPAFGQGFGTYQLSYTRYFGPYASHAHNLLLEPLLNYGLIGTLLLAGYLRINLAAICRLGKSDRDQSVAWLTMAILCCVAVHGLTDIPFFSAQTGLLLVLSLAAGGIIEHPVPAPARIRRVPAPVLNGQPAAPRKKSL